MSTASEILGTVRKMLLVDEDLTRLSGEVKSLSAKVHQLDIRLTVVKTTMAISPRLPGSSSPAIKL